MKGDRGCNKEQKQGEGGMDAEKRQGRDGAQTITDLFVRLMFVHGIGKEPGICWPKRYHLTNFNLPSVLR